MFNFYRIGFREHLVAIVAAFVFSVASVGAAVGPADPVQLAAVDAPVRAIVNV